MQSFIFFLLLLVIFMHLHISEKKSIIIILLGYVHTLPGSFCSGTKIIPEGASFHTQKGGFWCYFCYGVKLWNCHFYILTLIFSFWLRIFVPQIPHTCLLMVWAVMMSHKANLVTAGLWLHVPHWLLNLLSYRRFVCLLLFFSFWSTIYSQTCVQRSPLWSEKVTVIYRVTIIYCTGLLHTGLTVHVGTRPHIPRPTNNKIASFCINLL